MSNLQDENYNPKAYPCCNDEWWQAGMTLLDYFAGQALAGLTSKMGNGNIWHPAVIKDSYDLAEKMLSEHNKRLNKPEGGER